MTAFPGERRLQGAQAGALDIRHAPAQLDRFPVAFQIQQILDLPPVRHVDRPQRGLAHAGQFGRRPDRRDVPARSGARFGQAGPKHGSAPIGGATDFLPVMAGAERAMAACELREPFWQDRDRKI